MTVGGKGSIDVLVSPLGIELSVSSLEVREDWEGDSKKLYDGMFEEGEVRETSTSMLFRATTHSA